MEVYSRDIKRIIKVQETTVFHRKFPRPLKTYLIESYKYGYWPYGYDEDKLYSQIMQDAVLYFDGDLDVTLESPIVRAGNELQHTQALYWNAVHEKQELEAYIDELHEKLWANVLEERYESPIVRAMNEIQYTRDLYCKVDATNGELKAYIDELHEQLWANGLEGRQMLHDETGAHKGSYAEFDTLPD